MKVFLRNTLNGWYYKGPSKWTPRHQEARDLGQSAWAVEVIFKERLENVEILLSYDDPRHNVVLPVERHREKNRSVEVDLPGEAFLHGEESSKKGVKRKPSL